METYEYVPDEFADAIRGEIPGKWTIGGECPNCKNGCSNCGATVQEGTGKCSSCGAENQTGTIQLVDMGSDLPANSGPTDWADGTPGRFELRCSEYTYGSVGCGFEYRLSAVTSSNPFDAGR